MANLIYLVFLIPVLTANLAERDRRWRGMAFGVLAAINLSLLALSAVALFAGILATSAPSQLPAEFRAANWPAVAAVSFGAGILASLVLLLPVRRWLARWLPIDPDSVVHATALAFAAYQIAASLGQAALIGALENLASPQYAVTIADVLLSGAWLTLLALLGTGLFTRRGASDVADRLGLHLPTWKQALFALGVLALILAFAFLANLAWQLIDPAGFNRIDRITRNLFGGLTGVGGALVIGLSAGISEELLFRGAVQPRFGLIATSFLFAVGHLQYGISFAAVQIFVIGLLLGVVRNRTSTTLCIAVHAVYNIVNVLFG